MGVCLYTQCTNHWLFFFISLWNSHSSASIGHSLFPGFHPIVLKEKGLVAHLRPAGWLHSVLIGGDQQRKVGWGGLWQCITHWWSESVNQRGWPISAGWAVWVRAGHQIQTKTNTKTKTNTVYIHYSFFFFISTSFYFPIVTLSYRLSHLSLLVRCTGYASSLSSTLFLLGTFYPKHLLQCCVKVMCWLPYQEF